MSQAQLAVMNGRRLDSPSDLASCQCCNREISAVEIGLRVGTVNPDGTEGVKELQVIGKSEI